MKLVYIVSDVTVDGGDGWQGYFLSSLTKKRTRDKICMKSGQVRFLNFNYILCFDLFIYFLYVICFCYMNYFNLPCVTKVSKTNKFVNKLY